jgi:hypothetical protein
MRPRPCRAAVTTVSETVVASVTPTQARARARARQARRARGRADTTAGIGWWIQLGAFKQRDGALDFQRRLIDEQPWLAPLLAVFTDHGLNKLQAGPYVDAGRCQERRGACPHGAATGAHDRREAIPARAKPPLRAGGANAPWRRDRSRSPSTHRLVTSRLKLSRRSLRGATRPRTGRRRSPASASRRCAPVRARRWLRGRGRGTSWRPRST